MNDNDWTLEWSIPRSYVDKIPISLYCSFVLLMREFLQRSYIEISKRVLSFRVISCEPSRCTMLHTRSDKQMTEIYQSTICLDDLCAEDREHVENIGATLRITFTVEENHETHHSLPRCYQQFLSVTASIKMLQSRHFCIKSNH